MTDRLGCLTFESDREIPIADIQLDVSPMIASGYSEGDLRKNQVAWRFLFYSLEREHDRSIVQNAGSPNGA